MRSVFNILSAPNRKALLSVGNRKSAILQEVDLFIEGTEWLLVRGHPVLSPRRMKRENPLQIPFGTGAGHDIRNIDDARITMQFIWDAAQFEAPRSWYDHVRSSGAD
jgi:hypothetical protein